MAEPFEMPFETWIRVGPRKPALHWRHLVNTIETSMCDDDAAFCQITLTTCYLYDRDLCGTVERSISQWISY